MAAALLFVVLASGAAADAGVPEADAGAEATADVAPEDPAAADDARITPVQGDLSFSAALGDRALLGGALYFGGAYGRASAGRGRLFGGLGLEITYAGSADPYRISLGAQLRVGLAWATRRNWVRDVTPDLLTYLRITPFGAGLVNEARNAAGMIVTSSRAFFGLRLGLGATSIYFTRLYFENVPFVDVDGFWGEVLKIGLSAVLLPIVLLNHAEVAFEFADSRPVLTALVIRLGTGF